MAQLNLEIAFSETPGLVSNPAMSSLLITLICNPSLLTIFHKSKQ